MSLVLPKRMSARDDVVDSLANAVVELFDETGHNVMRASPEVDAETLVEALGQALVHDDIPATVAELLDHDELRGTVAIVCARDLGPRLAADLPLFLQRLETSSRTAADGRLSLVVVGHRDHLPSFAGGAHTDVAMAAVWWWNRVTRWDVAAHIAPHVVEWRGGRLQDQIRAEAIVEAAQWDLDLASRLALDWDGEATSLAQFVGAEVSSAAVPDYIAAEMPFPPPGVVDAWDRAEVDGWHSRCSPARRLMLDDRHTIRVVWTAQARTLMPWIEEQRAVLHEIMEARVGLRRMMAVLGLEDGHSTIEVGGLDVVAKRCLGPNDKVLKERARLLRRARNDLAHLRPMDGAAVDALVRAFA